MLLDLERETQNPTNPCRPDQSAGSPGGEFGESSPLETSLSAMMALLGATYGWVLAVLAGATALIVILFR